MRARHIYNIVKSSAGFSLTEALVGVGMITAIAFLVAKYSSETSTTSNRPVQTRSCEAVAQGVIDAVKGRGVYKQIYNFTPILNDRSASGLFNQLPLIPNLWPGAASIYNVNNRTTNYGADGDNQKEVSAAGFSLIDGYMLTLMTIYNTNPGAAGYCNTWTNNPQFTAASLGLDTSLLLGNASPNIQLQIKPYNVDTGANNICPGLVRAYPPGNPSYSAFINASGVPGNTPTNAGIDGEPPFDPTPGAGDDDYGSEGFTYSRRSTGENQQAGDAPNRQLISYAPAAMSGSNIGFQFHVRVSYTQNGMDTSCEASHNFQYYTDVTVPAKPTVVISGNNTTASNYTVPNRTNRSVTITFSHGDPDEAGVQLYCRDRSERLVYNSERSLNCYVGGAADPAWRGGMPSNNTRQRIGASVTQDWVPCDQVRACGRNPADSDDINTPDKAPIIRNVYSIPPDNACDIIIDVVAIDPAGNRSDTSTALQSRTQFKFNNNLGNASVIRRPRCINPALLGTETLPARGQQTSFGWWCDRSNTNGPWAAGFEPNGYYTTRSTGCCYRAAPNTNPPTNGSTSTTCTPR